MPIDNQDRFKDEFDFSNLTNINKTAEVRICARSKKQPGVGVVVQNVEGGVEIICGAYDENGRCHWGASCCTTEDDLKKCSQDDGKGVTVVSRKSRMVENSSSLGSYPM
ncbi:hypothetical protein K9M41_00235 [Candidatus Gracilibacteria bacterium]|nr:hypothetical protein [Candidatus Gracilibacteria bacterium]